MTALGNESNSHDYARLGAQIGDRVRRLRGEVTVARLAEDTGLDRSTIYKLEKGGISNPTLDLLLTIQGALGLASIEELLGDLAVSYASKPWAQLAYRRRKTPKGT